MEALSNISGYKYEDAKLNESHGYLLPKLIYWLREMHPETAFELGCGNGSVAHEVDRQVFMRRGRLNALAGVDPSTTAIEQARRAFPALNLQVGSGYDDLSSKFGKVDAVYSLEVVEHVYNPRKFVRTAFDMLNPGGHLILSTPYHGYLKNLALAATGAMERHFTVLWDHGHIKFWSKATLLYLLLEAGFVDVRFDYAGRFYPFSKSMFAMARKL